MDTLCSLIFAIIINILINEGSSATLTYIRHVNNSFFASDLAGINYGAPRRSENTSLVCYLAIREKFSGSLPPAANVTLCTHIIMLGSTIRGGKVAPTHDYDEEYYYKSVAEMKRRNPKLKVLLSNGGQFSTVLPSEENRRKFAESVVPYLVKYSFDGFDLDWEYPKSSERHDVTLLLQTLRNVFDNYTHNSKTRKFLLTAAVGAFNDTIKTSYEPHELVKYLDFVNVMAYDVHMFHKNFPYTGYNSPMYSGSSTLDRTKFRTYNLVSGAEQWLQNGMPKEKIMLGIPTYGHTFELLNEKVHGVYSLAVGFSKKYGDEIGTAAICKLLKTSFTEVWDDECKVPYAYSGKTWISYDNEKSVALKAKWIKDNGFGGAMTFSLDADDYTGACSNIKWPLHLAMYNALR